MRLSALFIAGLVLAAQAAPAPRAGGVVTIDTGNDESGATLERTPPPAVHVPVPSASSVEAFEPRQAATDNTTNGQPAGALPPNVGTITATQPQGSPQAAGSPPGIGASRPPGKPVVVKPSDTKKDNKTETESEQQQQQPSVLAPASIPGATTPGSQVPPGGVASPPGTGLGAAPGVVSATAPGSGTGTGTTGTPDPEGWGGALQAAGAGSTNGAAPGGVPGATLPGASPSASNPFATTPGATNPFGASTNPFGATVPGQTTQQPANPTGGVTLNIQGAVNPGTNLDTARPNALAALTGLTTTNGIAGANTGAIPGQTIPGQTTFAGQGQTTFSGQTAVNPFGATVPTTNNPFGQQVTNTNPFGTPVSSNFGVNNPFGTSGGVVTNPVGANGLPVQGGGGLGVL